jgi:hypothetical protein
VRRTTSTPRFAAGRASALCLVVGLATLTTVVGSGGSAGAATRGTSSWTPSEAALPDNGYNGDGPDLFDIACPQVQDCVSVGMYYAANGDEGISEGAIESLTAAGSTFTEAPLPSPGTLGALQSVSCPDSTFCVAVGSYGSDGTNTSGLIETFSDGQWTPTMAPAPAPGDGVQLAQVVCSAVGECVAIGLYLVPDGTFPGDGVIETLSDGSWTATAAPVPSNVGPTPSSQLRDLSCVSAVSCMAVGDYEDSDQNVQGLIETMAHGSWRPTEAPLPSGTSLKDQSAILYGVSCLSARSCVAVGEYSSTPVGLIEKSSAAGFKPSAAATSLSGTSWSSLREVTCTTSRSCAAIGFYGPDNLAYTDDVVHGRWTATKAPAPPGDQSPGPTLSTPICPEKRFCVSVGSYTGAQNDTFGLIDGLSRKRWTTQATPLPSNGDPDQGVALNAVACPALGDCVAVGAYNNEAEVGVGLIETQSIDDSARTRRSVRSPGIRPILIAFSHLRLHNPVPPTRLTSLAQRGA